MKINFFGAAGTVTGSKHLVTLDNGTRILLDCGLFQGEGDSAELNQHFGFDPATIHHLILSHAHADHSGLIPRLVKQGFSGTIYCTDATYDLCVIMLEDSAHIQESEMKYRRKSASSGDLDKPLYTVQDVKDALLLFKTVELDNYVQIEEGVRFLLTDAGHILGSVAISLEVREGDDTKKLFFSGDTGRYDTQLLRDPAPFPQADYIIQESTYGDRLHEEIGNAEEKLLKIVLETCVNLKGKLIIPAFSLGRTQEIVYSFDRLNSAGRMPAIPVYVDSPLAVSATGVMRKHKSWFNQRVQEYMQKDPNPFAYDQLAYIREVASSKALNDLDEPCIIISASGMLDAGRIKHHLKNNLPERKNTVLLVGFTPEGTLGDRLRKGESEVTIFGERVKVKARVAELDSYSAHGDYKDMLRYLSCQDPRLVKKLFLVHGEPPVQEAWKLFLEKQGFSNVIIPKQAETFLLD
jgi:metallo-beta-lactamase family protein